MNKAFIFKILQVILSVFIGIIIFFALFIFCFVWPLYLLCIVSYVFIVINLMRKNRSIKKYLIILAPFYLQILVSFIQFSTCSIIGPIQDTGTDYACKCIGVEKVILISINDKQYSLSSQCVGVITGCSAAGYDMDSFNRNPDCSILNRK